MAWYELVIGLFGEGGGASGGAAGASAAEGGATQQSAAGQDAQQQTTVDRDAEFERMIKGDYREQYEKRVKSQLDRRFKETDKLKRAAEGSRALHELLAGKYGVDASDVDALFKAAEADTSYYEEEAAQKGLTVEQLRHIKTMERENAALKKAQEERVRQENNQRIWARWQQEAEDAKRIYPNFDFNAEVQNEQFSKLLAGGVSVKAAYEAMHMDEIMSGGMQYAAQRAQQQTMDNIRARGMRPREGALGGAPAGSAALDLGKLTREQRAEIAARAKRGEKITF